MTTREEVIAVAKKAGFIFGYLGFVFAGTSLEAIERLYESGAASRDAEIQRLQMALADTEALELGTAEKCDQLRAELAAALAACKMKDEVLNDIASGCYTSGIRQQARDALAIKPDDAALKAWIGERDAIPEGWVLVPNEILDRFPEINPSNYDTSALEAMIAKAGETMRERIRIAKAQGWLNDELIRALPGVTLEDLK